MSLPAVPPDAPPSNVAGRTTSITLSTYWESHRRRSGETKPEIVPE